MPVPFEMSLRIPCRNARVVPPMNGRAGREGETVGDDHVENGDKTRDRENSSSRCRPRSSCAPCRHRTDRGPDRHHQHECHRGEHPCGVAGVGRALLEHGLLWIGIVGASRRRCRGCCRRGCRCGGGGLRLSVGDVIRRHAQKRPSRIPKARAKSPAREDFFNVMVLLLSVLFAVRVTREPRRRSRRCGCARRYPDRRQRFFRRRSVRSSRHR